VLGWGAGMGTRLGMQSTPEEVETCFAKGIGLEECNLRDMVDPAVMEKGSDCHRCSSNGTVSECPLSTRPLLPLPNRAIRFDFPALPLIGMISTWKPSGSSQLASR